jgi:hypothetical protein
MFWVLPASLRSPRRHIRTSFNLEAFYRGDAEALRKEILGIKTLRSAALRSFVTTPISQQYA